MNGTTIHSATGIGVPKCQEDFRRMHQGFRKELWTKLVDAGTRGVAARRPTASVGEPDVDVGVAEAGVSGPLRANIVKAPRFSVRAAAARQYWQVIIIRDLRRRPVP